ncbi:hypothetical protein MC885_008597 [Smutsia gigantea]|nr:hypothetical protein MC885_008597 [Smutsia gigantea]
MAQVAQPAGESQSTEVKTQQSTEKSLRAPPRRGPRAMLKLSQLLLGAITEHKKLTLAVLKKELGHAGYEVRRECGQPCGGAPGKGVRGMLLRVSRGDAAGCFRVCKILNPKRKRGHPRLVEGARSQRRAPVGPRSSPKRRPRRKAARKALEMWRRHAGAKAGLRRGRPRARTPWRSRAKEEARAKVMDEGRGRIKKEEGRPKTQERRPSSKAREGRKQDPEKPVKRAIHNTRSIKTDRTSTGQAKTRDSRVTCTKTSTKP